MTKLTYRKIILPNGLRLIHIPTQSLATTVLILVAAGSEYEENKKISGLSHFLEHLCFKGTKKRPKSRQIAEELDSLGAEYNAFTGNETTGYFAKAANKHFCRILDIVSDLYLNPLIDPVETEREKGVILEEINMYEDLPNRKVHDNFRALLYGDQPAGWPISGFKQTIQKMSRHDILNYRQQHYLAQKTAVVVAGGTKEDVVGLVKNYFKEMPSGSVVKKPKVIEKQTEPQAHVQTKEVDQSHLVLGARAFNIFDPRRHSLVVLNNILGVGMSSRLFYRIREKMGAAYYVYSFYDLASDYGYLAAAAGVDKNRLKEATTAILDEFIDLVRRPVETKELNKAKDHVIGNLILNLETSDEVASFYGSEEIITGQLMTPDEVIKNIQAVKSEDVWETAKYIFQEKKLNLALVGPSGEEKELKSWLNSIS